jgi:DNA-binding GntR family transcriptional regulator
MEQRTMALVGKQQPDFTHPMGTHSSGMSPDTIASDAHDLRCLLEPAVLRQTVGLLEARQLEHIVDALEVLGTCELDRALQLYQQAHLELYRVAPCQRLVAMVEVELAAAQPVLAHYLQAQQQRQAFVQYFRELVGNIAQGRPAQAVELLRCHLALLKRSWASH